MKVSANLEKINQNIANACLRVNRDPSEVKIIAVTKYVSTNRASEALDAGIIHLGENRDDGLLEKWKTLMNRPVWHFIGSLQTRKVKNVISVVKYIHSLDRFSLAEEINKRALKPVNCFIQVNVSGEETKHGMAVNEVMSFIENVKTLPNIVIAGLMTMAPLTDNEEEIRACFRGLKNLQIKIVNQGWDHAPCSELSMGMSNDYQIAIEEGATMIRIGTALVGEEEA